MDIQSPLSSDQALSDPSADQLGYDSFAKALASAIMNMIPKEGAVLAIYGDWGSGKTSVLNFVQYYLRQAPKHNQPIVMRFNPWWFSNQADLTELFFDDLQKILDGKWKKAGRAIGNRLRKYSRPLSNLPFDPAKAVGVTVEALTGNKDLATLKDEISDALSHQDKPLLVIIDDLDRLTSFEIRQIFRLIKAVANFPNIIYLLAFDKTVVSNALTNQDGFPGADYLDKIIQVAFDLPLPDRSGLRDLFTNGLARIITHVDASLFDERRWVNILLAGLEPILSTPRQVNRIINALRVTYPAVGNDVNAIDFIAIETIRIVYPHIYSSIRSNSAPFLIGIADYRNAVEDQKKQLQSHVDALLAQVRDTHKPAIRKLFELLFPKIQSIWSNIHYAGPSEIEWHRKRMICSPEHFEIYFTLRPRSDAISHSEFQYLLKSLPDQVALENYLLNLSREPLPNSLRRLRSLLDELRTYFSDTNDTVPMAVILAVVRAFTNIADQLLPQNEVLSIFEISTETLIESTIIVFLRYIDKSERGSVLSTAIQRSRSVAVPVLLVERLGGEHGKYGASAPKPETEQTITALDLSKIEGDAIVKVSEAARNNTLIAAPLLPYILKFWSIHEAGEFRTWLNNITTSSLPQLLVGLVNIVRSNTLGEYYQKRQKRMNLEVLNEFDNLSLIYDRASELLESTQLTPTEIEAIETFRKEYEAKMQGRDLDFMDD